MKQYTFTLEDSDYIEYLENQAANDSLIQLRSILFTYGSLPVLACALYATGVRNLYVYAAVLLLSLVWIPFSKKVVGRIIRASIEKQLGETGTRNYREMTVGVKDGTVEITAGNHKSETGIAGYAAYGHQLVLQTASGDALILPSRIFKDEKDLAGLLKELGV